MRVSGFEFRVWHGLTVLLGGSWGLVSKIISTLIGVISIVTLIITRGLLMETLSSDFLLSVS